MSKKSLPNDTRLIDGHTERYIENEFEEGFNIYGGTSKVSFAGKFDKEWYCTLFVPENHDDIESLDDDFILDKLVDMFKL